MSEENVTPPPEGTPPPEAPPPQEPPPAVEPPPAEPPSEEAPETISAEEAVDKLIELLHVHMPSHAEADAVRDEIYKAMGKEVPSDEEKAELAAAEEPKWQTEEAQKAFEEGLSPAVPRVEPPPEQPPS